MLPDVLLKTFIHVVKFLKFPVTDHNQAHNRTLFHSILLGFFNALIVLSFKNSLNRYKFILDYCLKQVYIDIRNKYIFIFESEENNMYKPETIKKLIKLYNEKKADFEKMDIQQLAKIFSISTGNKKIGHTLNVSLMPIITCHNCSECKNYCYDIKACVFHTNTTLIARIKNTVLLKRDRDLYFDLIDSKCSRRRTNKFFRWHVAGDILDIDYFRRMVEIARKHDDFVFWTYTKNYAIVNQYVQESGNDRKTAIPENFHIMFSEWDGTPLDNPFNFPIFTVKMAAGNKNHKPEYFDGLYKCPGNCDLCKAGHLGCIGGMNTYVDEH